MALLNLIRGLFEQPTGGNSEPNHSADLNHVESVLAHLPREKARYLAGFALLLARVAHADLEVSPEERERMKAALKRDAHLDDEQAKLVSTIALEKTLAFSLEEHIVLRELNALATPEQKREIIRTLFDVAAVDDISERESEEIGLIAKAFHMTRQEFLAIRSEFREHLRILKSPSHDST